MHEKNLEFINTLNHVFNEEQRERDLLHMTANENSMSIMSTQFLSSSLSNRYLLLSTLSGTQKQEKPLLYSNSMPDLKKLEAIAEQKINRMLGGVKTDFRPLSGVHAMICSIVSLSEPGELVVSINPEQGGHFATANLATMLGRESQLIHYDSESLILSLTELEKIASTRQITVLFLDDSLPMYPMDFAAIRRIVGTKTYIVYDASHSLGLITGGTRPNPLESGVDIIQGNTHKTFPGPQKALIHFKTMALAEKVMGKIDKGLVSTQHTGQLLSLFITIIEMSEFGQDYASQIIANTNCLSECLKQKGFSLLEDPKRDNESHKILILPPAGLSNFETREKLFQCNISTNAKTIFGKDVIRIGVQELTRFGMKQQEMKQLAEIFQKVLMEGLQGQTIKEQVQRLKHQFNIPQYSFDSELEPSPEVTYVEELALP